jgi:hypothetical protein
MPAAFAADTPVSTRLAVPAAITLIALKALKKTGRMMAHDGA